MKTGAGANLTGRTVSFFPDMSDDVIDCVCEFQNSAAKYAIALGIYKLAVFVAVGFFEVLGPVVFRVRFFQAVTPISMRAHCKIRSQAKVGHSPGRRTPESLYSL